MEHDLNDGLQVGAKALLCWLLHNERAAQNAAS